MTAPIGIYVRVSRKGDREDDRFHSPREQRERATGLVEARGLPVGPVFEDIDVSGATPPAKRPAMGEALAAIDRGELGGLAAYSLDRLSREPAHGDALVKRVTKAGGIILTPDIPDAIDSPTGEFTFGMLLQVAKLYRSQAGARFESAKERAIKAGVPVGPPPFGYRRKDPDGDPPDRTLEPDPKTAPIVRELFERRVAGESYTPLANFLDEATGRTWSLAGVGALLRNRIYATGRLEYGEIVSDVEAGAIVDEALWHAAQNVVTYRPPRSTDNPWLLTGLVRCAECGGALSPMTGGTRRRADPRRGRMEWVTIKNVQRRYRCRNRACPAKANVDAPRLEEWVKRYTFEVGDELAARSDAPDLASLQEAVDVAERRLGQVLAPEARDALGDLWAADVKARRAERDEALTRLGEATQAAGVDGAGELRLRDTWDDMTVLDRREALKLFWKVIRVGKSNGGTPVTFVARGPHAEARVDIPKSNGAP